MHIPNQPGSSQQYYVIESKSGTSYGNHPPGCQSRGRHLLAGRGTAGLYRAVQPLLRSIGDADRNAPRKPAPSQNPSLHRTRGRNFPATLKAAQVLGRHQLSRRTWKVLQRRTWKSIVHPRVHIKLTTQEKLAKQRRSGHVSLGETYLRV